MNIKLKEIIFNKLYEDLKHVEIIPYDDSVWLIDREKKYWFLRYRKSGSLWWRWDFFNSFFPVFSIESDEYEWVIAEWVEEVLNCKVETPNNNISILNSLVEEVLNCKVETPMMNPAIGPSAVEEVLNCKVETFRSNGYGYQRKMEEVLKCKVETPKILNGNFGGMVEAVLNCKVKIPVKMREYHNQRVDEVLNYKSIENER